jgi:hypothetical protein
VTHPESFPGRSRGRRARQDNGESEWQGQGAVPSDQREFPDLAPVRPQGARERDLRMQQGQGGTGPQAQAQAPQLGGYGGYGGYPGNPAAPQAPATGGQYGQYGQYAGGQQAGGRHASGGYPVQTPAAEYTQQYQAPQRPLEREEPRQQEQPQQPPRSSRPSKPLKQEKTPSWAEPDSADEFSERWKRRGQEAKQEEDQDKRRKGRRLLIAAAVVVAVAVGATVYLTQGGPGSSAFGFGNFVSTFQPGELQSLSNPCNAVSASTLAQDLPGKPTENGQPLNSGSITQSGQTTECTWTLDSPSTHIFRVLDVQYIGYTPSGLATGNGSATSEAIDFIAADQDGFAYTPKLVKNNPGLQSSSTSDISGMPGGNDTSGFAATQVVVNGGLTQDFAYDYVRYRNVIVRVEVQGNSGTANGKTYAASMSDLTPIATSVAKQLTSAIVK